MGHAQSRPWTFRMSAAASPRSGSPSSDSEAEGSYLIHLQDLKTLTQLYESKDIRPVKEDKVRFQPDPALLERVSLFQGDITRLEVDAIVNAANRSLLGGGGVDGAIHSAAGPKLLDECRTLNGCLTGQAKITRGYNLPANYIIHTVGPVYVPQEKEERAAQLKSCYRTSLELAIEESLKEIAFPSVSTGVYGYPIEDATHIALETVRTFLEDERSEMIRLVVFVVWSNKDKEVYEALIPEYFPLGDKPVEKPVGKPVEESPEPEAVQTSKESATPAVQLEVEASSPPHETSQVEVDTEKPIMSDA